MKYNVLVYGSGAREHALCDKISQSSILRKLFLALPNDGFKNLGEEIIFVDFNDLAKKCVVNKIDLAVIGPETPLAEGIVDILQANGVKCIGANKFWTQLESSKKFAKEFMEKHGIATARYLTISSVGLASPTYFDRSTQECPFAPTRSQMGRGNNAKECFSYPPVIKADGLAAGKGVHISESFEDAENCVAEFLAGKFGDASKTVIIEEKLEGEEISLISLFDGETLLPLIPARDYKKLLDGNEGENTGGMGAFCPVSLSKTQQDGLETYLKQLEIALKSEKADFCGVIYSGLILTENGIKVLEFNMRFGDPETQALLMHLNSDLLEIFIKMTEKKLSEVQLEWQEGVSTCVVLACDGYPQSPKTGNELKWSNSQQSKSFAVGLAALDFRRLGKMSFPSRGRVSFHSLLPKSASPTYSVNQNCDFNLPNSDFKIFFAGVKYENKKFFSSGGRVLSLCTTADDINHARTKIYKKIKEIEFENKIFRTDIGL